MNFWEDSPVFLNVARRYQADMEIAAAYMKESDIQGRLNNKGVEVDTRDFLPMILLMGIEGATEDERTKDIHQKLEKLADAFSDPDKSSRDDYLNLIYYMVDDFANDFDPVTMNMGDPAAVEKLLQSMLISQTITTKKKENPDYYNAKYPTPQARNLADACSRFIIAIGSTIATNLAKNNIFIKTILSLPTPLPENMVELQHLREKYEKGLLEEEATALLTEFFRQLRIRLQTRPKWKKPE